MGRLSLAFPAGVYWSVDIYSAANKFIINRSVETYKLSYYDLAPGIYNLKLNTVLVENVVIEEGKITRLKTGILEVGPGIHWELTTENKKFLTSGNKATKMAIPVGSYLLREEKNYRAVEIRDETKPAQ